MSNKKKRYWSYNQEIAKRFMNNAKEFLPEEVYGKIYQSCFAAPKRKTMNLHQL